MLFLLSTVFPGRTRVVALGAVAALTLTIFPWGICNWGPVYPNIAAFTMLPAICALFMRAFDQDGEPPGHGRLPRCLVPLHLWRGSSPSQRGLLDGGLPGAVDRVARLGSSSLVCGLARA